MRRGFLCSGSGCVASTGLSVRRPPVRLSRCRSSTCTPEFPIIRYRSSGTVQTRVHKSRSTTQLLMVDMQLALPSMQNDREQLRRCPDRVAHLVEGQPCALATPVVVHHIDPLQAAIQRLPPAHVLMQLVSALPGQVPRYTHWQYRMSLS